MARQMLQVQAQYVPERAARLMGRVRDLRGGPDDDSRFDSA